MIFRIDDNNEFRICSNYTLFNNFLNEVASHGEYPEILLRTFCEGTLSMEYKGDPKFLTSSLIAFNNECKSVRHTVPLTGDSDYILVRILTACKKAIELNKNIEIL